MKKLLYINSNPKAIDQSFGLQLGRHFLEELLAQNPGLEIETINLYDENIPLIDGEVLDAWGKLAAGEELSASQSEKVTRMNEILEQFLAADTYVFATPMWNLSYPPMLKAYIDNIVMAGRTFKYTESGPQGLLGGRTAVHVQSRGGVYSEGPAQAFEFTNSYLQGVMGFIGITDYHHVFVEGIAAAPDRAEEILASAKEKASELAGQLTNVNQNV
ncbi:FMN-dependent NADH-azoreductase [Fictibacillus aquaticus]|uniref:FMN dependent NADH:quinone oxidoreductase n=1 Tax=Fictibacillus aquaticus TaxID=2021314 RepID=A0A235FDZ7_9BACL|nr:FMN-dependent NADH-azoreductase [Fictibacillus aquaticus]OYD59606.1 FMN-dependent NADH-azoreductase [Fictibacillus aquaticus]